MVRRELVYTGRELMVGMGEGECLLRTIADTVVKCDVDEVVRHGHKLTKSSTIVT